MHSDCDTVKKGSHKHPSREFIRSLSWLFIKMMAFIGTWNKKMDLLRAAAYGKNIVIIPGNFQYFLVKIWILFLFCSQYQKNLTLNLIKEKTIYSLLTEYSVQAHLGLMRT